MAKTTRITGVSFTPAELLDPDPPLSAVLVMGRAGGALSVGSNITASSSRESSGNANDEGSDQQPVREMDNPSKMEQETHSDPVNSTAPTVVGATQTTGTASRRRKPTKQQPS